MKKYIIDTYAWIEYFIGSKKGSKAQKIIDNPKNTLSTLGIFTGELKFWSLCEKKNFDILMGIIKQKSEIIECSYKDWIKAATIKKEKRKKHKGYGIIDGVTIVKQKQLSAKILTGDRHFKTEKNVIFIS